MGLLSLAILMTAGCCSDRLHRNSTPNDTQMPYKVQGARDSTMMGMQGSLNARGVQVITMGQNYLVSIPAAAIFPEQSPKVNWDSYDLLNDVASYLKQFRKVSVQVNAYSNKWVSPQREHALTLARARAVADYLWSQGIDSRMMVAQGLGSDKPIVAEQGSSQNARIEITFRDEVA